MDKGCRKFSFTITGKTEKQSFFKKM